MKPRQLLAALLHAVAERLEPGASSTTVRCACGTYWHAPHDVAVRAFAEHLNRGRCVPRSPAVPGVYGPRQGLR